MEVTQLTSKFLLHQKHEQNSIIIDWLVNFVNIMGKSYCYRTKSDFKTKGESSLCDKGLVCKHQISHNILKYIHIH